MFSKWKIKGIDGYLFAEDGNLYKLPYVQGKRSYGLRLIKKQYPNRYRINGQWYSQRQLKHRLIKDEKPIKLIELEEHPF